MNDVNKKKLNGNVSRTRRKEKKCNNQTITKDSDNEAISETDSAAVKNLPDLFEFREEITDGLLRANKASSLIVCKSSTPPCKPSHLSKFKPSTASRFDNIGHWPVFLDQKNASRCANAQCKLQCIKCKLPFCFKREQNFFVSYHCDQ